MIRRILLPVDDSAAALAATRTALELAAATGATVHALHVVADHMLGATLRASTSSDVDERRAAAADSLLAHVAKLAHDAGVTMTTEQATGEPARCILDRARTWRADLVVLGRADHRGPGQPYIGHHTQHILEFAEQPVLTVPRPS
ncbi:universal stress protein [Amycolatopsis sp. K13G38]|uniref:Universal stress protein n=1 Tax=Amycolatopsis acididurans TaxID=2724524 RepID=A0ABX1JGJ8_9PSEU|nr:universal stress protein [Amycolatopsis acididurans]NKQ58863.1 universal stress protein [Amycolatopsis acididurans]